MRTHIRMHTCLLGPFCYDSLWSYDAAHINVLVCRVERIERMALAEKIVCSKCVCAPIAKPISKPAIFDGIQIKREMKNVVGTRPKMKIEWGWTALLVCAYCTYTQIDSCILHMNSEKIINKWNSQTSDLDEICVQFQMGLVSCDFSVWIAQLYPAMCHFPRAIVFYLVQTYRNTGIFYYNWALLSFMHSLIAIAYAIAARSAMQAIYSLFSPPQLRTASHSDSACQTIISLQWK